MSKYDPLRDYLAGRAVSSDVHLSFADMESLVGALPASARIHRAWWANDSKVEAQAWRAAGWYVSSVSLTSERVVFAPGAVGGSRIHRVEAARVTSRGEGEREVAPALGSATTGMSEATVQSILVRHLSGSGWDIQRVADTASRERGTDVVATREGRTLAVEVKGYPGTAYSDPRRARETKPTSPSVQARHWFSAAVLKAMLMREEGPSFEVAMAFPDVPTYRNLHARVAGSLSSIEVSVFFVSEQGNVVSG